MIYRHLTLLAIVAVGCTTATPTIPTFGEWPKKQPCANRNPERNVYYGDLHVHTAYSFDAYVFDTRNTPADAYSFAKGGEVTLPPLGADGVGTQRLRLSKPLDFVAVTDHGEFLGEVAVCLDPASPGYSAATCEGYRLQDEASFALFGYQLTLPDPKRFRDVCGKAGDGCYAYADTVWRQTVEAAEAAYDRSDRCEFTALIGYEYTAVPGVSNLHRNVIFRNAIVPERPVSLFDRPTAQQMWAELKRTCSEGREGCDVLAIPHNSNLSNGKMFLVEFQSAAKNDLETLRLEAELRAELEPLVEIFQHKGDSECVNGYGGAFGAPDEACNFEKLNAENEDCGSGTGFNGMIGEGCLARRDFVRTALGEGLRQEERLGINPFQVGIVASTDTHNGTPGATEEYRYLGHAGNQEDLVERRMNDSDVAILYGATRNPGGLAAIWAEENSRESLFDAMRRRETFGTSGTRIAVRMFGGWDYPEDMCGDADLVRMGYDGGVPMGGELRSAETMSAPRLVIWATQDVGTADYPGTPLQQIQMVKGWYVDGEIHEKVFTVAGDPDNGAAVDLNTCLPTGAGFASLCEVWTDPEFDPAVPAFYYARVLENPACRWSRYDCLKLSPENRPETCDSAQLARTIQERAWTSPIWFKPVSPAKRE